MPEKPKISALVAAEMFYRDALIARVGSRELSFLIEIAKATKKLRENDGCGKPYNAVRAYDARERLDVALDAFDWEGIDLG